MLHFIMLFDYTGLHCNNVLALQKYCRTANAAKTFTLKTQRDADYTKRFRNEQIQINV